MLASSIMPSKLPFMSSLCQQWILSFILCSSCLPYLLAKESDSSSDPSSLAPLWLSLANLTSLRECLQLKQGFYEFSPIQDVITRSLPHTNYTRNGVQLTLTAACSRHHYPIAEHAFHTFFQHQPSCSSLSILPAQSVFFLEPEGQQALTLAKVAFCIVLTTTFLSVWERWGPRSTW
uniref:GP2b protein n=1 Tax=Mikumi yellow baboon virus 1 TaxID=1546177 RepID=A0A089G1H7_9NIDO|nr:GP2b protein [Mikumi yellow baboon virus 1]